MDEVQEKDLVVGYICAAPFYDEFYRAKIIASTFSIMKFKKLYQ